MKKTLKIITHVNFVKKNIECDKVRDHCHLTGKYRGPAHNTCNKIVKSKDSNFLAVTFYNFSNYDCHMFFKKLADKEIDKVEFEIIPKKTKRTYL